MNENSIESFDLLISLLNKADQEADRLLGLMDDRKIGISDDMARYAVKSAFEGFGARLWGYDKIYPLMVNVAESMMNINHLCYVIKADYKELMSDASQQFLIELARETEDTSEQHFLSEHPDIDVREALLDNHFLHRVIRLNLASKLTDAFVRSDNLKA